MLVFCGRAEILIFAVEASSAQYIGHITVVQCSIYIS